VISLRGLIEVAVYFCKFLGIAGIVGLYVALFAGLKVMRPV
jgi:hypothetical protein